MKHRLADPGGVQLISRTMSLYVVHNPPAEIKLHETMGTIHVFVNTELAGKRAVISQLDHALIHFMILWLDKIPLFIANLALALIHGSNRW